MRSFFSMRVDCQVVTTMTTKTFRGAAMRLASAQIPTVLMIKSSPYQRLENRIIARFGISHNGSVVRESRSMMCDVTGLVMIKKSTMRPISS